MGDLVLLTVHSAEGVDQSYVFTDASVARSAATALAQVLDPSASVDLSGVVQMDDSFQVLYRYTAVVRVSTAEVVWSGEAHRGRPFLADRDTDVNDVVTAVITSNAHTRAYVLRGNSAGAVQAAANQLSADLRTRPKES